jgi:hypothetical protein
MIAFFIIDQVSSKSNWKSACMLGSMRFSVVSLECSVTIGHL